MSHDDLHAKAARGDHASAEQLLPIAIENRDKAAVLSSWRVLFSPRFNAWQAVQATLKAVLLGVSNDGSPVAAAGATQVVRSEIIAKALISSAGKKGGEDVAVGALLRFATILMQCPADAPARNDLEFGRQIEQTLDDALFFEDAEDIAAHVDQVLTQVV